MCQRQRLKQIKYNIFCWNELKSVNLVYLLRAISIYENDNGGEEKKKKENQTKNNITIRECIQFIINEILCSNEMDRKKKKQMLIKSHI